MLRLLEDWTKVRTSLEVARDNGRAAALLHLLVLAQAGAAGKCHIADTGLLITVGQLVDEQVGTRVKLLPHSLQV